MEVGGLGGSGLSVSPDGEYLAFELHQANVSKNSYRVAWFVGETKLGGVPINVGDGGDPTLFRLTSPNGRINGGWKADYAQWSPDSFGIAYRKRVNGETQIWWSSRDGNECEQLTHNAADVEEFYWSNDGTKIYFATGADRTKLRESTEFRNYTGHVFDYEEDWSTFNGRPYYPPYLLTDGEPRVWVLDIDGRTERLASDEELADYQRLGKLGDILEKAPLARKVAWTKNGDKVAWVQPDDPAKQGSSPPLTLYASLAADGRDPVRCPADECTGIFDLTKPLRDGLYWSADDDEILFVRKSGMGYSKRSLYGWKIGQQKARQILTTDEWISDCSMARNRALCFHETPSRPRTIVSIDLIDGLVRTMVDPNPGFRNLVIGDVELFEWENGHGVGTFGYLVKPPDYVPGRRYPMVIVGYRARWALRGGTGDEYPVHLLAANGFVVLVYEKPTTHEANEIYSDPLDFSKANWGPDLFDFRMSLASFKAAIRILTEKGIVDAARVGVTGLSNGMGHVNYALIHSDLFATAVTSSSDWTPSNYFLLGASSSGFFSKHRNAIGIGRFGTPSGFLWPQISLSLNVERVDAPLLVNASDNEHIRALEGVITLLDHKKPVEMVVYPDEHHIKWQPAHRASIYERNVDWLKFWLQGIEDSSPEKVLQYARWRKLRDQHIANLRDAGKEYRLPLPSTSSNSAD